VLTGPAIDNGDGTETVTVMMPEPVTQRSSRFLRLSMQLIYEP
jgi:hypothetical protein